MNCDFVRYEKIVPGFFSNKVEILEGLKSRKGYIYKFIDFNTFEKKETKIPDGFKKVILNKNIIKDLKCNNTKIILEKNDIIVKKIKELTKGYKKFLTHYNGGRPYLVYVKNNELMIYEIDDKYHFLNKDLESEEKETYWMYTKLVKKYKTKKIFIDNGSSLLAMLSKYKYVFIGFMVYEFSTDKELINNFKSPIGPNDVPYPIARGDKNLYFMLEKKYISKEHIPENILLIHDWSEDSPKMDNPYIYFYELSKINKELIKDLKDFKIINYKIDY